MEIALLVQHKKEAFMRIHLLVHDARTESGYEAIGRDPTPLRVLRVARQTVFAVSCSSVVLFTSVLAAPALASTATWADCEMRVEFDGEVKPVVKAVGRSDVSSVEIQTAVTLGVAQMAFCIPGTTKTADQLREATSLFLEDARFSDVRTQARDTPTGPSLRRKAKFRADDGTLMRAESECRGLRSRIACATFIGMDEPFPAEMAGKFFASFRVDRSSSARATGSQPSPSTEDRTALQLFEDSFSKKTISGVNKQPWAVCVEPLIVEPQSAFLGAGSKDAGVWERERLRIEETRVTGVSQLSEQRTKYGKRYVLLAKRTLAKNNSTYECEVSREGDFISGRPLAR